MDVILNVDLEQNTLLDKKIKNNDLQRSQARGRMDNSKSTCYIFKCQHQFQKRTKTLKRGILICF